MRIETEGIHQTLEGSHILKGIDFQVHTKQFVGILGPNGSGKSTFLHCLYRVARPTEGIIYFDGQNIESLHYKDTAKKAAVVAQHNYYNFDFTVEEVVLMGRSPHKKMMERNYAEDYQMAEESLKKVGMINMKKRHFSTLSGGEQQRVILARALTQDTECLILDEPTNHLDIKYQLEMMQLVKQMNRTVVAAIHDLNIAALYCDYIYMMKEGKVAAQGKPETVLTPAVIESIYGVKTQVINDAAGRLHVLYEP